MIHKLYILLENKLVLNKFSINLNHNKITINSIECKDTIIKIPVYNKFNGIKYIPITIPLELPIYQNIIINPYMILSSYNISNEIDFFGSLSEFIDKNFNLKFKSFEQFVNDKPNTFARLLSLPVSPK